MKYSNDNQADAFVKDLGSDPFYICDMDGNVVRGYTLAEGHELPLGPGDNEKTQSIPFGTSREEIAELVKAGVLKEVIFASKAMDVRLPQELVDIVNKAIAENKPFKLAFLTSRGAADALRILKESGVHEPEKATLVADSGASLYINGVKSNVRVLTPEEELFLDGMHKVAKDLEQDILDLAKQMNLTQIKKDWSVLVESKGIGRNIHFREALEAYGQGEKSEFDHAIGRMLKERLSLMAESGPREQDGSQTFATLGAPAAVELKVAKINKGHGLEALIEASFEYGANPTGAVFSGDDVSKGDGTAGTDYYAMAKAEELSAKFNIPVLNSLTLHPVGQALNGNEPDMSHWVDTLSDQYPRPKITLIVPTPAHQGKMVVRVLGPSFLQQAQVQPQRYPQIQP